MFLIILFSAFIIGFQACCRDDGLRYCSEPATITGVDYRECVCCGGWFIEIGEETLRAMNLPEAFVQSFDAEDLPLPVYLEWRPVENPCLGDEIKVTCIRRR